MNDQMEGGEKGDWKVLQDREATEPSPRILALLDTNPAKVLMPNCNAVPPLGMSPHSLSAFSLSLFLH